MALTEPFSTCDPKIAEKMLDQKRRIDEANKELLAKVVEGMK